MRRVATALVAALIGVLAGCSDGERANQTLPSTSTDGSAEPSETTPSLPPIGPADFPMPVEAREKTEAGAEAFLDYYLAVEHRSTDGEALRQLSRNCQVCSSVADQKDADLQAGYTASGGEGPIEIIESVVQGDQANVIFKATASAVVVVDGDGNAVPERGNPGVTDRELDAFMLWSPVKASWLMTEFAGR